MLDALEAPEATAEDRERCALRGHRFRPGSALCVRCGFVEAREVPEPARRWGKRPEWDARMDARLLRCLAEGGTREMAASAAGVDAAAVRPRLLAMAEGALANG